LAIKDIFIRRRFTVLDLLLVLVASLALHFYFNRAPVTNTSHSVRRPGNYQLISPLVECEPDSSQLTLLTPLKLQVQNQINQLTKKNNLELISVYFRDLNNGPWFGINQDELFSPASLIKVPIMMAYFKIAESDPAVLTNKLVFKPTPKLEVPNITPAATLTPQESYTIQDLIERMIIHSDNDSFSLLTEHLGTEKIKKLFSDLDVDLTQTYTHPLGNNLGVRQYASFFRILYNASYLSPEMSEKALSLLTRVEYKKGLNSFTPNNIKIAHKFGERSYSDNYQHQLHDCGIVYFPKSPYLICIMTRGNVDFPILEKAIQSISQNVFAYFSSHFTPN
jgi:beta-lactamase class A